MSGDRWMPVRVRLWDAIDAFARACGADTSKYVGSPTRQRAVASVEKVLREVTDEVSRGDRARQTLRGMMDGYEAAAKRDEAALRARVSELEAALRDACDGWEDAAQYKGDYLREKHGDLEDIEALRAKLPTEARAADAREETRWRTRRSPTSGYETRRPAAGTRTSTSTSSPPSSSPPVPPSPRRT